MKEDIKSLKEFDNYLSSKLDSLIDQVGTLNNHTYQDFQANSSKLVLDRRANDSFITREFEFGGQSIKVKARSKAVSTKPVTVKHFRSRLIGTQKNEKEEFDDISKLTSE